MGNIDFIDLKTPLKIYKNLINKKIKNVLDHGQFILGPEVFNLEKQFLNRHSADAYVSLMIEDREYDSIEYFLFEQSHDYQHKDESPMEDLQEVVNGWS